MHGALKKVSQGRAPWGGAKGILGRGREGEGACQELWLPGGGGACGQAGGSTKAPTVVVLLLRKGKYRYIHPAARLQSNRAINLEVLPLAHGLSLG